MKLLILTTQDKFFLSHIVERAEFFQKKGWEVSVAIQITEDKFAQQIKNKGFEVFDTKIERRSINPLSQLIALYRLFRIYWLYKPDLVWHLGAKSIAYGTLVCKILRIKQPVGIINAPIGLGYVYASNSTKAKLLRPLVDLLYRLFLNPAFSRVIVENLDDINIFIKKGSLDTKDAYCILGAGVDTSSFVPLRKNNAICKVVMAARLIREKGVWDFVRAAEILHDRKVPVRMILVGAPDYGNPSSITREEFEILKKNPSVECLGYQSDIKEILGSADVFCHPSFYREGLPRVLIEAASCGLALLTTDTIGCRETIRGNNGFLFQSHDVVKLAQLLEYLVNHPEEVTAMGQNSREIALMYFDSHKICKRTYEVFNGLWESMIR